MTAAAPSHQIETVPSEVIALLHWATVQPSSPRLGPS